MKWFPMALIGLLIICATANAQTRSVLVTPRVTLDVQQMETTPQPPQPAVQYVQPQQQYVQPQQQYAQPYAVPQTSEYSLWHQYLKMQMWNRATYEKRGILFPRYIRRPDATQRQMMLWYIWNQRQ